MNTEELDDLENNSENEISEIEKTLLDNSGSGNEDDANLMQSQLDDSDEDGDLLNEEDALSSGRDLDVPGASADDANEAIGSEDEENNYYSEADTE